MAGTGRRLSRSDREHYVAKAIELRVAGHTQVAIAKMLGFSNCTIALWTQDVPQPDRRLTRANARKERALELRAQGYTQREIAAELGVSTVTAYKYVRGVPRGQR